MIIIFNIIVLICFTALAIYFEKWWIVLFAYFLLFQRRIIHEEDEQEHDEWQKK